MWGQRLIRLLFFFGVLGIVLWGTRQIASQNRSLALPTISVENLGAAVLGSATRSVSQLLGKPVPESINEPIMEPSAVIQSQTQTLIESLKKLPADQLEAVKKQLLKEFCDRLEE